MPVRDPNAEKMELLARYLRQGWKVLYPAREDMLEKVRQVVTEQWNEEQELRHKGRPEQKTGQRLPQVKSGRNFKQAADQFLQDYQATHPGKRLPRYITSKLRVQLLPYFGARDLSEISASSTEEYCNHRKNTAIDRKTGKRRPPSKATLRIEVQLLRRVIKTAERHGWILQSPRPPE
jgi:hypothetical protein